MEKIWRWATSADWRKLGELYADGFGLNTPERFYEDFPLWDPRFYVDARHQLLCFENTGDNTADETGDDARFIASASVIERAVVWPSGAPKSKVGVIGGVVVLSSERGSGLGKETLDRLLKYTEQTLGLQNWVLWTGNPTLYASFGFIPVGEQLRARGVPEWVYGNDAQSSTASAALAAGTRVMRGFSSSLWRRLRQRDRGLFLRPEDEQLYARFTNIDWWWLEDTASGECRSFVAIGRGIDLPNMIHEWGGTEPDLRSLLGEVLKVHRDPEWLFSPAVRELYPFLAKLDEPFSDPLAYWRSIDRAMTDSEERELWFWGGDSS